jgi:hypothetical protein
LPNEATKGAEIGVTEVDNRPWWGRLLWKRRDDVIDRDMLLVLQRKLARSAYRR